MTVTGGAASDRVASVPGFAVDRPGLVERLDWAMRKRVVLVVAPAGYGKSVLLAQWAEAHPHRRVVWTEARATDDAPAFGRRLVDALDRVTPGAAGRAGAFLGAVPGALGESVLAAVAAELAALAPVVLVIEDLEELSSPELRRELAALAERVPDEVTFVWASRDDRFPGIEPLRVRDEVVEIRQAALALSSDEGAEVVARMGGPVLDPVAAAALHTRTEGWPAGVQLAALGLRDHEDPGGFIADFAGDDRHVADYLSGEVLARQSPEITHFLLRTAVLDRLSGPLCDVVTGRDDSQRTLEHLDGQSLFLRPLDRRREWFTYHPLFRDLLRYELRAARPGAETALLQRAVTWHRDRGESEAAAEYLVRAADWSGVIALADAEGATYFAQSRPSTVIRWLEQVPLDRLLADTDAVMALAGLLTMSGRTLAAQDLVERLEQSTDLNVVQQTEAACFRACWTMHHAPPEAIVGPMAFIAGLTDEAMARRGGPLLGVFSPAAMRAITTGCAAVVHSQQADYGRARDLLTAVEQAPGSALWLLHALAERAWVDAATGNLRSALAHAHRAFAVADEAGLAQHQGAAMAHLAAARAHRERAEVTDVDHLEAALARGRMNDRHRVLAAVWGERAHQALVERRVQDGLVVINQAEVSGGPPWPAVERARLAGLKARLLLLAGDPEAARRALDGHDGLVTAEVASASASVAAADNDIPGLRKVVEDWSVVDVGEPAAHWSRDLWCAVLADLEGDRRAAIRRLGEVVEAAEVEGAVRPFLDGGGEVHRLVRALYRAHPTPYLRRLVDGAPPATRVHTVGIVEQLTERELEVLRYLPSRLSNADIAERLYVSVNTLKTHVKNIYRKLGVGGREEAIERAEELGLL